MKFTLSWLKDHLETTADATAIGEALTSLGLEVESIENKGAALRPFTVAFIEHAEPHPNADKLRVCRVQTAKDTRTIVCGAPNARAGIKVVMADIGATIPTNGLVIKQSAIRGVESSGMMCSARELGLGDDHAGIIELPADAPIGASVVDVLGLDDPLFDIAITANRADCMSVRGIARDLAAKGVGTPKPLPDIAEPKGDASAVSVSLATPGCLHFVGCTIRGVRNGESPAWLRARLESVGLRPISALVDITNYFTLTYGRPLHVYDVAKLQGNITVRRAAAGEAFDALNGKHYTVPESATVIADDSGVIGLGGIVGGTSTGVSETTTDVFLESAWFDPICIASNGRALNVLSDARARFERGIDAAFTREGALRAVAMIVELCGGTPSALVEAGEAPLRACEVPLSVASINALGGTSFDDATIRHTLEQLGFALSATTATAPSWRVDISEAADLAEEVLRVQGYQHIQSVPLPVHAAVAAPVLTSLQKRISDVRRLLANRGLLECYSWSFVSESMAAHFCGGSAGLKLQNPISAELSDMRPSLLPHVLEAAANNARRGLENVALYEVGLQWRNPSPTGQQWVAACVRTGLADEKQVHGAARAVDALDAKADAFAIIARAGLPTANLVIQQGAAPAWYHPGQSAAILLGKHVVGYMGALHPATLEACGVETAAVACEILLEALPLPKAKGAARPSLVVSDFQASTRDFAFLMPSSTPVGDVVAALRKAEKQLLQRVEVFDVYTGKGVPEGQKSVALRIVLQAMDRTLTDADIERVSSTMIGAAASVGATLRP